MYLLNVSMLSVSNNRDQVPNIQVQLTHQEKHCDRLSNVVVVLLLLTSEVLDSTRTVQQLGGTCQGNIFPIKP